MFWITSYETLLNKPDMPLRINPEYEYSIFTFYLIPRNQKNSVSWPHGPPKIALPILDVEYVTQKVKLNDQTLGKCQ